MKIIRPQTKIKIPKTAEKVFSGVLFDVYQWQQKMYDGSYEKFEVLKRKTDTVNIYPVTSTGKIILTKQSQPGREPFIGCLGGRMDEGEDALSAAKRELVEESGLKANKWELWFSEQPSSKTDWAVYTFIAKDLVKFQEPTPDNGEKIQLIEYSFDKFIELVRKEEYRDKEVSLKIFNLSGSTIELAKLKRLFFR